MLWLYTSQAGEETLTQTLGLVTPWGTASNDTPLTAMQVEQVGAGILPEPALDTAAAAGLGEAARALARDEDGALRNPLYRQPPQRLARSRHCGAAAARSPRNHTGMTGFGKRSNFPHLYPLFFLHGGGLKIAAKRDIMLIIERVRLPAQQKAAASGCNTAPFFACGGVTWSIPVSN